MTMTHVTAKPDRRELRYQKLCASIERWQRKVDKADRIMTRGTRVLIKLERQRRRAQLALSKPKAEATPPAEHPRIEAKQEAIADALVESAAPIEDKCPCGQPLLHCPTPTCRNMAEDKAKSKPKRKPKAKPPTAT